jgi:hypothetical protein
VGRRREEADEGQRAVECHARAAEQEMCQRAAGDESRSRGGGRRSLWDERRMGRQAGDGRDVLY